jgi:hypothetical protein
VKIKDGKLKLDIFTKEKNKSLISNKKRKKILSIQREKEMCKRVRSFVIPNYIKVNMKTTKSQSNVHN